MTSTGPRRPQALATARRELADEIDQVCFAQFLLFRQGDQLKTYAHSKGVRLIGDLPFFASPDCSDVWANPELFLLDEQHRQRFVAGVPPDYFTHKDNCGETPFTTGMHFERAVIGGRLTEYVLCLLMWMRFGWTTFADLRRPGTCPQVRQGLRRASGYKARVRTFSKLYPRSWAACRSSSKISESLLRMCGRCVTNFNFPEHVFCSLLSTVIPIIHICLTASSATLWSTPARMTTRQLESGTKNCLTISVRTSGITSSEGQAETLMRHLR
jgi:hypothetical protein